MYIYMIDLDILENVKLLLQNNSNNQEGLVLLKTNGQCILQYTKEEYEKLLQKVGNDTAKILSQKYLGLMDLRAIYDKVKLDNNDNCIRNFKLKIYSAITECKGIVILDEPENIENNKKRWFEFWK